MDPNFYQVLHTIGICMVFLGYGALLARSMAAPENLPVRKLGSVTSGIGLLLILDETDDLRRMLAALDTALMSMV